MLRQQGGLAELVLLVYDNDAGGDYAAFLVAEKIEEINPHVEIGKFALEPGR